MLNAPVPAAEKVLMKAGLTKDDIDVWEINEAFSVVAERFIRKLELGSRKGQHQWRGNGARPPYWCDRFDFGGHSPR